MAKRQKILSGTRGVKPDELDVLAFDGTLKDSDLRPATLQSRISRRIIYTVLCGITTPTKAKQLSGYAEQSKPPELLDPYTPAEIRTRLQRVAGTSIVDQVAFYADIRDDKRQCTTDRLSAAKQIDKTLGYEAPSKVEVNTKREVVLALQTFQNVLHRVKLTPQELAEIAEAEITDAEIVAPSESQQIEVDDLLS